MPCPDPVVWVVRSKHSGTTAGMSRMSGIIVHEWIEPTGGAEKVVEAFTQLIPSAPVLCLWDDAPGRFDDVEVRESILAKMPFRRSKALALPVMPAVWRY